MITDDGLRDEDTLIGSRKEYLMWIAVVVVGLPSSSVLFLNKVEVCIHHIKTIGKDEFQSDRIPALAGIPKKPKVLSISPLYPIAAIAI